jgi:hypothetical protein
MGFNPFDKKIPVLTHFKKYWIKKLKKNNP